MREIRSLRGNLKSTHDYQNPPVIPRKPGVPQAAHIVGFQGKLGNKGEVVDANCIQLRLRFEKTGKKLGYMLENL